jgi:hypothetical protein
MAVKDARSVRAAQRSKILDGHRSVGYARQRALSTCRNSLPRGAPFYNAFYAGLRWLDAAGVTVIVCPLPAAEGIGLAIRDRLVKAGNRE